MAMAREMGEMMPKRNNPPVLVSRATLQAGKSVETIIKDTIMSQRNYTHRLDSETIALLEHIFNSSLPPTADQQIVIDGIITDYLDQDEVIYNEEDLRLVSEAADKSPLVVRVALGMPNREVARSLEAMMREEEAP